MPDNESILSGLLKPTQYATPEQRRRAQQHAYALMQQPDERYTSWTQGVRDIAKALVGRHIINQTNEQESNYMAQNAQAAAAAAPTLSQEQQSQQQPQTKIDNYAGPVPSMHTLPSKEAIQANMRNMSEEGRQKYLEHIQKLSEPVEMEVDNGKLIGNPLSRQWTFQPKTQTVDQMGVTHTRQGNQPYGLVAPGENPSNSTPNKPMMPVVVNSEQDLHKLPKGTPVIFNGRQGIAPGPQ